MEEGALFFHQASRVDTCLGDVTVADAGAPESGAPASAAAELSKKFV
jgi:hypothetical protein